jgi:hypothetical protein
MTTFVCSVTQKTFSTDSDRKTIIAFMRRARDLCTAEAKYMVDQKHGPGPRSDFEYSRLWAQESAK